MSFRSAIPDFSLANSLYTGATVTFYGVDLNGDRTAFLPLLYANPVGPQTVSNPQVLDGEGKFSFPVYHDAPLIAVVAGIAGGSTETGIIMPAASWGGDWTPATVIQVNTFLRDPLQLSIYAATNSFQTSGSIAGDVTAGNLILVFQGESVAQATAAANAAIAAAAAAATSEGNAGVSAAAAAASAAAAAGVLAGAVMKRGTSIEIETGTTGTRPATAGVTKALLRWSTTFNLFEAWDLAGWRPIVNDLREVGNVDDAAPTDKLPLVWDAAGSAWKSAPYIHNHENDLFLFSGEQFGMDSGDPNNSPMIQAALDALALKGGGVLVLPASSQPFQIADTILVPDHCTIVGQGPAASVLRIPQVTTPGGGLTSHPIVIDRKTGVRLRDFSVVGNRAAHPGVVPSTQFNGILAIGATDLAIERVMVQDIENDGIVLALDAVVGGTNNAIIKHCRTLRTKNGILVFKGGTGVRVESNWVDYTDLVGILCDDATAADTTSATAVPNVGVVIRDNLITNYSRTGSAAGLTITGSINVSATGNTLRGGGIVGVDAAASKSAVGIVVNSGENRHNASIGCVVADNMIDGVAGGQAVSFIGTWNCTYVGNTQRNLFQWPTGLSGAAINLLQDNGGGTSPQKSTLACIVDGNTVEKTPNTAVAVQIAATVASNNVGPGNNFSQFTAPVSVAATAGEGQINYRWVGTRPTWNAAYRGAVVRDAGDDMTYEATTTRWRPVGVRVGALPAHTAAQRGDLVLDSSNDKLNVATNSAWVVVGTQT